MINIYNLSYVDKVYIDKLFNQGGYVLDFATESFDNFTINCIRIPICEKYKLSKGKSLKAFFDDPMIKNGLKATLLEELLKYYEAYRLKHNGNVEWESESLEKCWSIVEKLKETSMTEIARLSDKLVDVFNSEYIAAQVKQMHESVETHPTDSIGKSKELLESCCQTILNHKGAKFEINWTLQRLVKETCKELRLTPDDIPDKAKASDTIKKILQNLSGISHGMAELRNMYGTGHGKSASYKGLTPRHARLAIGSAITTVYFLWETFEIQDINNEY